MSGTNNPTKTATVQSIADLMSDSTLDEVLTAGNVSTKTITTGDSTVNGTLGVTGLSTLASVDINGPGNIDNVSIGQATPQPGTFTTLTGSGNLTIDTDTLFVDATTNRVGVGTATPTVELEVDGDIFVSNLKVIGRDNGTTRNANIQFADVSPSGNPCTVVRNGGTDLAIFDGTGNVGIGTTSPNAAAILDVTSTSKGLLLPRMDQTQKQAMANVAGMLVWDTTNTKLCVNNGSGWLDVDVS